VVGYALIAASVSKSGGSLLRMSPVTSRTTSSLDFAPPPDAQDYRETKIWIYFEKRKGNLGE